MKDHRTPEEIQAQNVAEFLEKGPGLRFSTGVFVVARDPNAHAVLLGGLGAMGVGQMWFKERPDHADYAGYDEAPLAIYVDPWWIS